MEMDSFVYYKKIGPPPNTASDIGTVVQKRLAGLVKDDGNNSIFKQIVWINILSHHVCY